MTSQKKMSYTSPKTCNTSKCQEFFETQLNDLVMKLNNLPCNTPSLEDVIPRSTICLAPAQRTSSTSHHPHLKTHTQCPGCRYASFMSFQSSSHHIEIVEPVTTTLLHAKLSKGTCLMMCSSSWLHSMITSLMLDALLSVSSKMMYFYICDKRGFTIYSTAMTKRVPGFNKLLTDYLSTLDAVNGFLSAPDPTIWHDDGIANSFTNLSWTPKQGMRWVAPNTRGMRALSLGSPKMDTEDVLEMEIKGWKGTLNATHRRKWNEMVVIISLGFHKHWSKDARAHTLWPANENIQSADHGIEYIRKSFGNI